MPLALHFNPGNQNGIRDQIFSWFSDMWSKIRKKSLIAMRELMHLGIFGFTLKVWYFLEGKRRNTGRLTDLGKPHFWLQFRFVPIVAVVFSWYQSFLNVEEKILKNGNVIVTALPAISTIGMTADDVDELFNELKKWWLKHSTTHLRKLKLKFSIQLVTIKFL